MVPNKESQPWEIERRFISPERAKLAGMEALALVQNATSAGIDTDFAKEYPGSTGIESLVVDIELFFKKIKDFPHINGVMEPIMNLEEKKRTELTINCYRPSGATSFHVDHIIGVTHGIALLGVRKAYLRDLSSGSTKAYTIFPGDRLSIHNPTETKLRPRHQIINIGGTCAVAIGY